MLNREGASPPIITNSDMETYYGLKFNILPKEEIDRFTEYDRVVAQCHIANCGCIIVDDKYGEPIDNEYDLAEIYEMILNS